MQDLEARLRGERELVGTPVRLQDGALWIVPAMPIEGSVCERLCELLATRDELVSQLGAVVTDRWTALRKVHQAGAEIAWEALRLNYPGLAREALGQLVSIAQVRDIVHALNGVALLAEITGEGEPEGKGPAAA